MAGSSLLALLDDITTLLDDVATLSKVAVRKTSGVVGDDLALNAEQVTGFQPNRELPVVWAVAKGSFLNKLILVPAALAISAFAPTLIIPLLMIGGLFLCYEGVEKVVHKLSPKPEDHPHRVERVKALADKTVDLVALERTRIKGAIRTDFILSAEIVVIALGTMSTAPMTQQVVALSLIAIGITVLVYGLVAGIVKLDDLGMQLLRSEGENAAATTARTMGAAILRMAPWLMRTLSVVGTAAMFLVGGSILVHGIPPVEHGIVQIVAAAGVLGGPLRLVLDALVGIVAGAVVVGIVWVAQRLRARNASRVTALMLGALVVYGVDLQAQQSASAASAAPPADSLDAVATGHIQRAAWDEAIAALEPVVAWRQQALAPTDRRTKEAERRLASALRQRAAARAATRPAEAWRDYQRALTLSDAAEGARSDASLTSIAAMVQLLGPLAADTADGWAAVGPDRVLALAERALGLLRGEFGANDPRVQRLAAEVDGFRTIIARLAVNPRGIRDAAARAVASAESAYGPEHPETATALLALGEALVDTREFDAAREALARVGRIRRAALGDGGLPIAELLRAEGRLAERARRAGDARAAYESALAMAEAAIGAEDPRLAPYLQSLADLLAALGDAQQAARYADRAAALPGASDRGVGSLSVGLARVRDAESAEAAGDLVEARRLREQALVTLGPLLGPEHIVVGAVQAALARTLVRLEAFDAAAELVTQVEAAAARTYGRESVEYGVARALRADLQSAQRDIPAATATLQAVVALNDRVLGPTHPAGFTRRVDLVMLLHIQRRTAEATRLAFETARAVDRYAREELPSLAVAEQQAFLEYTLAPATSMLMLSAHATPAEMPAAYDLLGGWKGLLLRGVERQAAVAGLAGDPAASADLAALTEARSALAALLQRAASMDAAEFRRDRDRLTAEKERLERALAARLPAAPDPWRGWQPLRDALPERSALVDVFRHGGDRAARYAAIVTVPGGAPREVDLGPADRLEQAVQQWRNVVTGGGFAIDEFWRVVGGLWDPVARVLPESLRFVWISPDAQLSRVPWATLAAYHDRTGAGNAAQVPSARALHAMLRRAPLAPGGDIVLVGGVNFDAGEPDGPRPSTQWPALPGTAAEVSAIANIVQSASIPFRRFGGDTADVRRVAAALQGARLAHLATHGFFFGESEAVYDSRGVVGASPTASVVPLPPSRNPLAESGLALAGANASPRGNLTAEDLLTMDLSRLELMVLSACETGRGTEITGQGVLGLQASLLAAGVRGMVMSLWKVPDESTAFLMERFYHHYLQGRSSAWALRRAQAETLERAEFRDPVHWAGWVFVGSMDG